MSVVKTSRVSPKRTSSLALGLSLWTGVVGPILFVLVETIDGAITPGYSAMREAVSYLELGPGGWIQILNFLVTGLLLILFALGFFRWMRPLMARVSRAVASALLALTGVGLVMASLFLPDPIGVTQHSVSGILHNVAFSTVFFPLGLACLFIGSRLWRAKGWRIHSWYGLIIGLPICLIALASLIFPQSTPPPWGGLFNRVVIIIAFAWYVLLAIRLLLQVKGEVQAPGT